jgi:proline iminopeptidase
MDSSAADLYPAIDALASGMLPLDHGHCMYWESVGNPKGVPVVFLHGGPGAGCTSDHRRFFDPATYHIVLFDQRGAGRSTPAGCIEANTTNLLVADMERLREHLGIERWLIFGGSWGSTLALAYGEVHPLVPVRDASVFSRSLARVRRRPARVGTDRSLACVSSTIDGSRSRDSHGRRTCLEHL